MGSPAQQTTLFGAAANPAGFEAAIHTAVHRLGRHLGFQAFNVLPTSEVRAALFTRKQQSGIEACEIEACEH